MGLNVQGYIGGNACVRENRKEAEEGWRVTLVGLQVGGNIGWESPGLPCREGAPEKPEGSRGSEAQTCLNIPPSSVTDQEQPMGRMVLMQTWMMDVSGAAGSLINHTSCTWQSAKHDHHRYLYFCFIELMILPERATCLFSYHVHSHHDRRGYRSRDVSDLGHCTRWTNPH